MQTNITRKSFVFATGLLFALATIAPTAVLAQGNSGNSNRGGKPERVEQKVKDHKEAAQARIAEKRAAREERSLEKRQAACERRITKIDAAMGRLTAQAERHLGVFDSFYEKVQAFYEDGPLTVDNYDELTADVDDAREAAQLEIEALEELNVDIDCEDADAVVSMSAHKDSAAAARDALKAYRKTLVALISSMRAEAAAERTETETETEDEDAESEVEDETETETESENESSDDTADDGTGEEL